MTAVTLAWKASEDLVKAVGEACAVHGSSFPSSHGLAPIEAAGGRRGQVTPVFVWEESEGGSSSDVERIHFRSDLRTQGSMDL